MSVRRKPLREAAKERKEFLKTPEKHHMRGWCPRWGGKGCEGTRDEALDALKTMTLKRNALQQNEHLQYLWEQGKRKKASHRIRTSSPLYFAREMEGMVIWLMKNERNTPLDNIWAGTYSDTSPFLVSENVSSL